MLNAGELMKAELDRYDWAAFRCACAQSAAHLPGDFLLLAAAKKREDAWAVGLENHLMIQSFPQEPAVPAVPVLMAALTQDLSVGARTEILDLLLRLIYNDDEDVSEACQQAAQKGLWLFYAEIAAARGPDTVAYACDILKLLEPDQTRLADYRASGHFDVRSFSY
ncbi:hypothetical protein ACGFSG_25720 [Streptomyces sp. NPDC048512]|uniref:hypothetical protein n=1 Tax=unclassified Streptomyces TaxID=2593676 RepID=UPI0009BFA6C3|nr:hypothetical protein [Streptomyces sp. M41(2017)]OQQ13818.1 hypothetical protein B0675_26670 [Streptomyces sp. M41(2017)]